MAAPASSTLSSLRAALAEGRTTSVALVEEGLERARASDGRVGAFLSLDADRALAEAERSDRRRSAGESLSPLDGLPIGIKDNLLEEGAPATAGSKILEGFIAPYDATVVRKLREAGAVLVGRLNCDEFGMGSSTENSAWRPCRNPWDLARVPGGSSGGSAAAVAAGFVAGALGSDTGGSVRQPAALCGVVGLKPSWGRVSRFGLVAFASSLDVVGPLASDVEGAAALLEIIAGPDPRDATSAPHPVPPLAAAARGATAAGLTLGVPRALLGAPELAGLHAEVRAALEGAERALAAAGARVVDVELPHAGHAVAAYYVLCAAEASSNLARFDGVRYGPRRGEERGLAGMYEETRALFGAEVKRRIVLGSWVLSAGYYDAYTLRAQKVRRLVADDFARALSACDALLLPTSPEPAWKLGEKSDDPLAMYLADVFTVPASLAGLPALSLNAGFSAGGLPLGVQLVGRAFDEEGLVRAGAALERALALRPRTPPLTPLEETA
jgi:aspartyl-tRNA(Asn)/glutamyl-tRNA(Gln) amidotransferase subunit A